MYIVYYFSLFQDAKFDLDITLKKPNQTEKNVISGQFGSSKTFFHISYCQLGQKDSVKMQKEVLPNF